MALPKHPFLTALSRGPLLCDGAMGTLLYERGAATGSSFAQLNLTQQSLVQQVHVDYINSGAEVIETNSYSGNRYSLEPYGLAHDVWNINVWAAKVARNAREIAGRPVWIAGSMGPAGNLFVPLDKVHSIKLFDAFQEQMEALLAGGVDLFILETMPGLQELALAVKAARKVSTLPVVALMSFSVEGRGLMGATPEDMANLLDELGDDGPDVIGINCGAGPIPLLEYFHRMRSTLSEKGIDAGKYRFSCIPNAGLCTVEAGRYRYSASPEYCASFVEPYIVEGVDLLGGCCGTTPKHIALMRAALNSLRERQAAHVEQNSAGHVSAVTSLEFVPGAMLDEEGSAQGSTGGKASNLLSKLPRAPGKGFFISVELDPPKGSVIQKIIGAARTLKKAGADAINIGDSPMARVRMSSLSTSYLIGTGADIDTIVHFTTRDRNIMGIQADLLGAHALGVCNILALTGDPPSVGAYAHATAVYDVDSVGLIRIIAELNRGYDIAGSTIGCPTNFAIGCALNPTHEDRALEKERLQAKIAAGAHFIMTQPIYQKTDLTDFLEDFGHCRLPIIVGIMPLHSSKHAEYLHNEVPGISIPEDVRRQMELAGSDGARVGLELAHKLLEEIKPLCSGTYIVPSFGRYDDVSSLVEQLKEAHAG